MPSRTIQSFRSSRLCWLATLKRHIIFTNMDEKLKKRIDILLTNTFHRTPGGVVNYTDVNDLPYVVNADELVDDNPEGWKLNNSHTQTLIKLSQQLSSAELQDFHDHLLSYITGNRREEIVNTITLYFVHTNQLPMLLDHIKKHLTSYSGVAALTRSMHCIADAMRHRPDIFPEKDIEALYDWCEEYFDSKSELGREYHQWKTLYKDVTDEMRLINSKANEILARNFERQVDAAFNPELNTDEQKVIEEIEALGLPLDLGESMRHINELVAQANAPMKYRDAMSAMRAYTERLYEQVARSLDSDTKIDGKDSEAAAKFFRSKKLLSQDMADMLIAHRHFLSNDGAHRIKSRREDARIAKNMTIEISLYIITRLREVQQSQSR